MKLNRLAYWGVAFVIVLLLGALAAWHFFLQGQQRSLAEGDAGRGAGLPPQAFTGKVGSTYENVLSSFTTADSKDSAEGKARRLTKVGQNPTSGAGFITNGTSTELRLVERSTGNVLGASLDGSLQRLTNTLVQHVFDTVVMKTGRVIMRSLDENGAVLTSVGGVASTSKDAVPLVRRSLPNNIRSIVGSPDGEEVFYILGGGQGALGIRAKWDGSSEKQLFSSALSGWQLHWTPNGRIVLVQNASDGIEGYAYAIEKNGDIKTLARNVRGLTLLPHPNSQAILYSASSGGLSLYARPDDGSSSVLLPVRTIAEKCVWAPGTELVAYCAVPQGELPSSFLDRWYRGEVHTRDAWWKINVNAGSAELLYSSGAEALDVERPTIDESGSFIAFRNATDQTARILRIAE